MVSKLSALSLALAAASILACDLSTGGQTIAADITQFNADNQQFMQTINDWQVGNSTFGMAITSWSVSNDVTKLTSDLSGFEPTECDIQNIISALGDAAPGIIAPLEALTTRRSDYVNIDLNVGLMINGLATNAMDLISATYELLPCGVVNETFDAFDSITDAFATAQQAFSEDITAAPTKPMPCGNTTPPSCTKQQAR